MKKLLTSNNGITFIGITFDSQNYMQQKSGLMNTRNERNTLLATAKRNLLNYH